MSGFYLFVLWLSDEKVSIITISCSLLYEGSERCSLTVCIEKNNVLKKPLKNMGIKMGKKYSCFIGGSINRIERKIYFWHCDTFWICSHCHYDPSILLLCKFCFYFPMYAKIDVDSSFTGICHCFHNSVALFIVNFL